MICVIVRKIVTANCASNWSPWVECVLTLYRILIILYNSYILNSKASSSFFFLNYFLTFYRYFSLLFNPTFARFYIMCCIKNVLRYGYLYCRYVRFVEVNLNNKRIFLNTYVRHTFCMFRYSMAPLLTHKF